MINYYLQVAICVFEAEFTPLEVKSDIWTLIRRITVQNKTGEKCVQNTFVQKVQSLTFQCFENWLWMIENVVGH